MMRIFDTGSLKMLASWVRTTNGFWVVDQRWTRPSGSNDAMQPWGSSATCWVVGRMNVSSKMCAHSAKPCSMSPLRSLKWVQTLVPSMGLSSARSAKPCSGMRTVSCTSVASSFTESSTSMTAGRSSYSTTMSFAASSAASRVSAATAATGSPTCRTLSAATMVWSLKTGP